MRDGALWRRHVDHVRKRRGVHGNEQSTAPDSEMDEVNSPSLAPETQSHTQPHPESQTSPLDTDGQPNAPPESEDSLHAENVPLVINRYPSHTHKPPERLYIWNSCLHDLTDVHYKGGGVSCMELSCMELCIFCVTYIAFFDLGM